VEITKVQITLHKNPDSKVRAFCNIVFDDVFVVKRLVIMKNLKGEHFVNMPNYNDRGRQIDIAFPIKDEYRRYIENRVLDEYEIILNKIADGRSHGSYEEE
jgi:stage V sporulation protein G